LFVKSFPPDQFDFSLNHAKFPQLAPFRQTPTAISYQLIACLVIQHERDGAFARQLCSCFFAIGYSFSSTALIPAILP